MNRKTLAAVAALFAATTFGVEYKWTGAVSSDFAEAGNWLVRDGALWVATETPPLNEHGTDDIVFEGEVSEGQNMPVLGQDYGLRRIFFRSGGWTLTVDEGFKLSLVHGSGGWGRESETGLMEEPSIIDSSGSGVTNKVSGVLYYNPGCAFTIEKGSILNLDVALNTTATGYKGTQGEIKFFGEGTAVLTGTNNFHGSTQVYRINKTTVVVDMPDAKAFSKYPLYMTDGKLVALQKGQMGNGNIYLSGDAVVDLGGFYYQGNFHFGASSSTVSAEWTGFLQNVGDLRMGANDTGYSLSPKAHQVVFPKKVDGPSKWTNNTENNKIKVGDIPGVEEEIVFNGPLGGNVGTNSKNGGSLYFNGLEIAGQTAYGAVSLNAATDFRGIYTRAFITTTLYVNDTGDAGKSSLGSPLTIKVNPNTGVLRGDGVVMLYAGDSAKTPELNVYGTLAPGNVAHTNATLSIGPNGTKIGIVTTMRTNSVFRIQADPAGDCPAVVQNAGTFAIMQPEDGADEAITAPKIVVSGAYAPAQGRHRVLTVTGTLEGQFAPEVVMDFPKSSQYTIEPIYSQSPDGKTFYVDLRVGRIGMAIIVR